MARKSILAREAKRQKLAYNKENIARRESLKKVLKDPNASYDEKMEASFALSKMRRNTSKVRLTNRCQKTGVSRAVYKKFGLNRIPFREMALNGELPGVTKASW